MTLPPIVDIPDDDDGAEKGPPPRWAPLVRDHATFGMVSGTVTGSLSSLHADPFDVDFGASGAEGDVPEVRKPQVIEEPVKPRRAIKKRPTSTPDKEEPGRLPHPVRESVLQREMPRMPTHTERVPRQPEFPEAVIDASNLEEPPSLRPAAEEPPGFSLNHEQLMHDAWKDQKPDLSRWDLEPLCEGIRRPNEPNVPSMEGPNDLLREAEILYTYCHRNRGKKPKPGKKQTGQNTHTHIHTKEIVYIEREVEHKAHAEGHEHHDEDHDCPVCNAAKPKKPTVAQLPSVAASSVNLRSIASSERDIPNLNGSVAADDRLDARTMYTFNQGKSMYQQSECDQQSVQHDMQSEFGHAFGRMDTNLEKEAEDLTTWLHPSNTFIAGRGDARTLQVNERGQVYRDTETTRRMVRVMNPGAAAAGNADHSPGSMLEQTMQNQTGAREQQHLQLLGQENEMMWSDHSGMQGEENKDFFFTDEENAWARMQRRERGGMAVLEDVEDDSNSQIENSQLSGFGDRYLQQEPGSGPSGVVMSQETHDFNVQASAEMLHHRVSGDSAQNVILQSLDQREPAQRGPGTRYQQVQRELRTQADALVHEHNPA